MSAASSIARQTIQMADCWPAGRQMTSGTAAEWPTRVTLTMNDTLVQIYLNDHLAGFVAATELAKRCLANNREGSLGEGLKQLIDEFREEQTSLKDMLACSGGSESLVKQGAGWLAEKIGRLKCNGSLLAYSDLSRVVELEALLIIAQDASVFGETCAWVRERDSRFAAIDFSGLKERAQRRTEKLRHYHLSAVQRAFAKVGRKPCAEIRLAPFAEDTHVPWTPSGFGMMLKNQQPFHCLEAFRY